MTERVFVIHVEAFDWNCQQHIIPRFTTDRALERENADLRSRIASMGGGTPL